MEIVIEHNEYLMHYGVKGMRWGVRRYENEDGSLTELGKKKKQLDSAKRQYKKRHTRSSEANLDYAKREFKDAKTRLALEKQKKKSKRQLKLEERYKQQGFTDDEAAIKAYNRTRTERIVAAVGAVTLASVAAYVAYKHYDRVTDTIISKNSDLGRVTITPDEPGDRAFYAYLNRHDKNRYQGLYGKTLSERGGEKVYQKVMKATGDIKVASPETGRKTLESMISSDKSMKDRLLSNFSVDSMLRGGKQSDLARKAYSDLKAGKITDSVYDAFNIDLVGKSDDAQNFYSKLKQAGYGAVRDQNDKFYSGYFAKNPMIVFDSSNINVDKVSELGDDFIKSRYGEEFNKIFVRQSVDDLAPWGAAFAGAFGGLKLVGSGLNTKAVAKYRKEHPNSKLTNNEILRLVETGKA